MSGHPVRIRTRAEPAPDVNDSLADAMPETGPLVDAFGRVHTDLRISVTDRCNLRCMYCMPEEGMVFLPRNQLLTYEEIARVAGVAYSLGVRSVRLSGGEPLYRRDLDRLIAALYESGFADIALTTNAMLLADRIKSLTSAGLTRVNVSCDSLDGELFSRIRRGGDLSTVLTAMDAAEAAGIGQVKVNVVLIRGVNDHEVEALAEFGRRTGRTVRFIEFMPLDAGEQWHAGAVVPSSEVVGRVGARWPVEPVHDGGVSPAARYRYLDGGGEVGVIPSVTAPFCGTCDRLRLTAEGNLRNCLFAREEIPLRPIMRGEAAGAFGNSAGPAGRPGSARDEVDAAIALALRRAVWRKKAGHGIGEPGFTRPARTMSMIGG